MPTPKLLINGAEESLITGDLVTIGRAPDNSIAFPEDSNVSRYHAEIEDRGGAEYWVFDLNSSNGTTLNGERLVAERPLADGDLIVIGGSQEIEVVLSERTEEPEEEDTDQDEGEEESDAAADEEVPQAEPDQNAAAKTSLLFVLIGIAIGLAVISAAAVAVIMMTGVGTSSACSAGATIESPRAGDIINSPTSITVTLDDVAECVSQVVYLIDEEEVASSDRRPFSASIDPNLYPGLADGIDHKLKVVLVDSEGNRIPQNEEIALSFDTLETETPSPTPRVPGQQPTNGTTGGPSQQPGASTLTETKAMTDRVLPQLSGKAVYVTGNPQFLDAVSRTANEYVSAGYYGRAATFSDVISTEFIQERGLDPPLGFILAMSRSKFFPLTEPEGAGLWKMDNKLVQENGYNGLCGNETIAHKTQNCAAIAASNYVKDLFLKAFEGNTGDIIYVIAAFGMSTQEAAEWKDSLPANRRDFWTVLANRPKRREEVVRFFAASIVAENPKRFGLQDDKPLSTLYRDFMK